MRSPKAFPLGPKRLSFHKRIYNMDEKSGLKDICMFISLILLIFSVFFVSLAVVSDVVYALDEDAIFEGDTFSVSDGSRIDIFNYTLSFVLDADGENIFVDEVNSPAYSIISLDACSDIDLLEICFESSSGSTIYATMFTKIPFLTFETSLETEEAYVGETNSFNITIRNEGRTAAESARLIFDIPNSIRLEYLDGDETDSVISDLEFDLDPGEEKKMTLEFLHTDEVEEDSIDLELIYDNFIMIEQLQQTLEFSAEDAFWLDISTEPEDVFLGNPFTATINLTNVHAGIDDNITLTRFIIPLSEIPGLHDHRGFVEKTPDNLFWSGRLREGISRIFSFSMDPSHSGTLEIPLSIYFNDTSQDEPRIETYRYFLPFNITSRDIMIDTNISEDQVFDSSTWHAFDITLTNLDENLEFRHINISVEAHGNSERYNVSSLGPRDSETIRDIPFLAPVSDGTVHDDIHIDITYENEFGEKKQHSRSVTYISEQIREVNLSADIEKSSEGSYRISTHLENMAGMEVSNLHIEHKPHDDVFFTGYLNGSLETLEPGGSGEAGGYRISTSGLNFSADDYMFDVFLRYEVSGVEREFSHVENLSSMFLSLYDEEDLTTFERTQEAIERYFTSTTVFGIFALAIFLIIASLTTVALNKRKFTIQGYDSLERKQHSLEKKKHKYDERQASLEKHKTKLQGRIKELKQFMDRTRRLMDKEVPVISERRDGLKTRQEELLEEKKLIDQKIEEMKEIERRLLKRNRKYEEELKHLDHKEKNLNQHLETVKYKLTMLNKEMDRLLEKEGTIGKEKEKLNKKELGIIAEKQRLIKMGSDKFSNEKMDVIQEKIQLQHEKNVLEEELQTLSDRKDDITDAQQSIHQQKADLEKEKNIFDMNKEAVESSLEVLREQSDKIKGILDESRATYIDDSKHGSDTKDSSDSKDDKKGSKSKKGTKAGKGSSGKDDADEQKDN